MKGAAMPRPRILIAEDNPQGLEIGRAHVELQSHHDLVCRLLLEKKKDIEFVEKQIRVNVAIAGVKDVDDTDTVPCTFLFNDTATTEIYTLSLHDALPI